jgi:hypothetical protein
MSSSRGPDRPGKVVARFPSLAEAEACYRSPEYQAALEYARGAADRELVPRRGAGRLTRPAPLSLAELLSRFPRPGRIEAILPRPARYAEPVSVGAAGLAASGLGGDHARLGKRALTLLQAEHLPVISSLAAREATQRLLGATLSCRASTSSRSEVSGCGWARRSRLRSPVPARPARGWRRRWARVGTTQSAAMGGWCATVVRPGRLSVGDRVMVLAPTADHPS